MLFILLFYGLALGVIAAAAYWAFRALKRWGSFAGYSGAVLVAALAVLLWPIPIHGGFLLLGEVVYDEWSRERERTAQADRELDVVRGALVPRFAGALPVSPVRVLAGDWALARSHAGEEVWLDGHSGMIWSGWSLLPSSADRPTLEMAKTHCAGRAPRGYWALSTAAEEALLWQAGGHEVMPAPSTSWMSYSTNAAFGMELPSYHLLGSVASNRQSRPPETQFSVRCVARSESAPVWGFTQDDIGLELWNAYQLWTLER